MKEFFIHKSCQRELHFDSEKWPIPEVHLRNFLKVISEKLCKGWGSPFVYINIFFKQSKQGMKWCLICYIFQQSKLQEPFMFLWQSLSHFSAIKNIYFIHNVHSWVYSYVIVIFMFDENVTFYQHVWRIVRLKFILVLVVNTAESCYDNLFLWLPKNFSERKQMAAL